MTENEATVDFLEEADAIYSDELVYKAMLHGLVERGIIKMLCSNEPKRQQSMLHFLHALLPSAYSEEAVLGLDGIDYSLLPKLDEPFDFFYDKPHVVSDHDIVEIYMVADEGDSDEETTGIYWETSYGKIQNPTEDDLLNEMEQF